MFGHGAPPDATASHSLRSLGSFAVGSQFSKHSSSLRSSSYLHRPALVYNLSVNGVQGFWYPLRDQARAFIVDNSVFVYSHLNMK
jgi:hypothetical protein